MQGFVNIAVDRNIRAASAKVRQQPFDATRIPGETVATGSNPLLQKFDVTGLK
jgi:hypothetical protein